MLYRKLIRLFLFMMTVMFVMPEVSYSMPKLSHGLSNGYLYLYLDKEGGPDACTSGIELGDYVLWMENERLIFGLRWMGPPDGPWDPWFSWNYGQPVNPSQFMDPKSTLCARYGKLYCYRDRIVEKDLPWASQAVGPCTPEEIATFSLKDDVGTAYFNVRITINGDNIKVEPIEACCSSEGKCKKEVLWQRPTLCPEGTVPLGKGTQCFKCETELVPDTGIQDSPPDREQENIMGCCLPGGICRNLSSISCNWRDGTPLTRLCNGESDPDCTQLTGACMVGEKCIESQPKTSCKKLFDKKSWQRGVFLGLGSHCPPPETEMGACCVYNNCSLMSKGDCMAIDDAIFMADVTTCDRNPCTALRFGCCLPEGICDNIPPEQCNMLYGTPLPRSCIGDDDVACDRLTGACMVGEKCEPSQTEVSCESGLGGEFLGIGRKCLSPEPEKSACCVDGVCTLETEEACDGQFMPELKSCEPDPCKKPDPSTGGCCDSSGICINGVLEANCPEEEGKTFFPGGCPEKCPAGACYMPCPTSSDKEDCIMTSENKCASISNSRFGLNEKCIDTGCLNCSRCQIAVGKWVLNLPDEHATLTLNKDCTSQMLIRKQSDENTSGLPITSPKQTTIDGLWGCSDQMIKISWEEGAESTLIMGWEDGDLKLCYPDGEKTVCANRDRNVGEVTVEFTGTYDGVKEGPQP